jgi:hypothetical protein
LICDARLDGRIGAARHADAPMRSKPVTKDSTFHGALLHDASCQPTTAKVDTATTEVIESTSHKGGYKFYFNLALLFCAVVIK